MTIELKRINFLSVKMVKEKEVEYECVNRKRIIEPEIIADICINVLELHEQPVESVYMFTLNTKNEITGIFEVSRGSLNASIVQPREVYQRAILNNANSIILAHNHPSGDITPSNEDINITNKLIESGNILGIRVMDHIIIGDTNYLSFRERNLM